jgi:hypothetical protein
MKPETVIPAITRKTFSRQWPSWSQQIVAMEGPIAEASRQVFDVFWGATTLSDSQYEPLPVFSAIGGNDVICFDSLLRILALRCTTQRKHPILITQDCTKILTGLNGMIW